MARREITLGVRLTHDGDGTGYCVTAMTWSGPGGEPVLREMHEKTVDRRRLEPQPAESWRKTKQRIRQAIYRQTEKLLDAWETRPEPLATFEVTEIEGD